MIARKPSILIYTHAADDKILKEICAGIEEEGVFYDISEKEQTDVDRLAFEAAGESVLGSGIGISGTEAAFQMSRLPVGRNIMKYRLPDTEQCRLLGTNSARAVKREPLKEIDDRDRA
ncbi:MAG: glycerol dehydratase reactivase beta/small subunit family protein [Eubacteriales bacterium]